jgi:hypothetical protein
MASAGDSGFTGRRLLQSEESPRKHQALPRSHVGAGESLTPSSTVPFSSTGTEVHLQEASGQRIPGRRDPCPVIKVLIPSTIQFCH